LEGSEGEGTAGLPDQQDLMISRRDDRLFRQAVVMAALGQGRVRVGVVLARGRRPYVWEHNVSGPTYGEPFLPGHAEQRALKQVVGKTTAYVARIDQAGTLMPSVPCMACSGAIEDDGNIRRVVYYDGTQIKEVKV
jgi:tRNA(Arg) A34 adenosine deaminase TadA